MKKLVALLFGAGLIAGSAQADLLVAWDFAGLSGTNSQSVTANVAAVNMVASTNMFVSRGDGLVASSNAGGYAANNWHSDVPSLATAIASNNYFQFTLASAPGFDFNVTNMTWNMRRSGTGPSEFVLRSSADGYAANLASWVETANTTGLTASLNVGTTNAVTFRLYGFGGTSAAGSMNIGGAGNDVEFYGTVIPEPGTMALMGLGLLAATYLRRQKYQS